MKWKKEDLLDKKPEAMLDDIKGRVDDFKSKREELDGVTAEGLLKMIKLKEEIQVLFSKVGGYYQLKFTENTGDSETLAKISHLNQLQTELGNEMIFFRIWFMNLDDEKAKEFMEAVPEYKYYLHQIRRAKKYTKSEEVEQIISLKSVTSGAFADLYDVITNAYEFDFNGEKGLGQEEVMKYVKKDNPELREEAYEAVLGRHEEDSTVLSEIYKNIVIDWKNEGMSIRGFESPISVRNFENEVGDEAVEALLSVIKENSNLFQEYFKLKKKVLGDHPYSRYHIYAPCGVEKEYSFEDSKELVLDTFKKFDPEFGEAAKEIFEKERVHSHPAKAKRSGAFCMALHTNDVPYLMLNHTDDLNSLFTMMHELGHGVHYQLARGVPDLLYDASLPMAETASVFAEMLLASRMLEESEDEEEQKAILMDMLDSQYATVGRQAFFTLFEKEAHKAISEGASKEDLSDLYEENLEEQFGDMEIPDVFRNEWNYIPHFHHSPFYCYAYSWGNLLTLALYETYREEGEEFVEKYKQLLAKGGSDSPENMLAEMGIDPSEKSFWQKGFDVIGEEVEKLKSLIN